MNPTEGVCKICGHKWKTTPEEINHKIMHRGHLMRLLVEERIPPKKYAEVLGISESDADVLRASLYDFSWDTLAIAFAHFVEDHPTSSPPR